jgi:uncharacterized protein DUF1236
MKNLIRFALVASALVLGVSVAAAANTITKSSTTGSAPSASGPMAKDTLSLTRSQQKTAWKDISAMATKETAPARFAVKVGTAVPNNLTTHPVPSKTADQVPALRPYQYALLSNNELLIVNPSDKKVAEIIRH